MARVKVDEAYVRLSLDSRGAERDARRAGERAGKAFAKAANAAAGQIAVEFDIDEAKLRRQLKAIDAEITVGVNFDDDEIRARVRELERLDVDIPVRFDVQNDAALQAQIRRLETTEVTIPALVELADAEARAQLAALGNNTIDIPANVDLDTAAFDAQIAALTTTAIDIPANVDVDDTELAALRARIEATRPTIEVDVDVQQPRPVVVRGRLVIDRESIDRQLNQIGALRLNVDEAAIAAQVAAGIKAGEQLAGDVNVNVDTNSTTRVLTDQTGLRSIRNLRPIRARIDPDTRNLDAALRRLSPRLRVTVDIDADSVRAALAGLDDVRLSARLDLDGTALGNELRLIEEYFRARPVKVAATLDVDRDGISRVADQVSRKLSDTLIDDLGPQGTRRVDLEVDPELDTGWVARLRAELAAQDLSVRVEVDQSAVDEFERAQRRYAERQRRGDAIPSSADFLRDQEMSVELRPSWPPPTDSTARAEYERWADSLPSVEVEVDLDDTALGQARRRIEDTLSGAAADVDVDLDDTALRARLDELTSDITITIRFKIEDAVLRARLERLTDGIDIPVRFLIFDAVVNERLRALESESVSVTVDLDLDTDQVQARLNAITAPRLTVEVDVRIDDDALRRANLGGDGGTITVRADLDTSRFDAELAGLRRTPPFTVTARIDLDSGRLDAELAGLRRTDLRLSATIDLITARFDQELAGLRRTNLQLEATLALRSGDVARIREQIAAIRPTIEVRLAIVAGELARIRQQINNLRPTIEARLDVDTAAARARLAALSPVEIEANLDLNEAAITARIAAAVRAGIAAGSVGGSGGIGGAGGGLGGGGAGLGGLAGMAPAIAAAIALAPALAVAGAAITAAWGAVSTAIAAVPGVLALLAAPVAAVALGFEGVKRAAATLRPEFEALQSYTENLLQDRLTPVFETLRAVFPTIAAGMEDVTGGIGRLAQSLADVFAEASVAGGNLQLVFDNVGTALGNLRPGFAQIAQGFLLVAAQSGAFDALTEGVNRFGGAFRDSVTNLISDGTMAAAFEGLGNTLGELAEGFVSLVDNGIEVFAAAAPGLNTLLSDITDFFNRFDYASLGESVGGVFSGIGEALRNVPTSTIRDIEAAFADLSDVFQSQGFQDGLQGFIGAIPEAIDVIGKLTTAFGEIGEAVGPAIETFNTIDAGFRDFTGRLQGTADGFYANVSAPILEAMGALPPGTAAALQAAAGEAEAGGAAIGERGGRSVGGAFGTIEDAVNAGGAAVTGAAGSSLSGVPGVVEGTLAPIPETTLAILQQIAPIIENSFNGLSIFAAIGMSRVATAVQNGGAVIANSLRVGLLGLDQVVAEPLGAINQQFQLYGQVWQITLAAALASMSTGVATGMAAVQAAVAVGLEAVNSTIIAGAAVWGLSVTFAMQSIAIAASTGFVGVQAAAALGMTSVNSTIIAGAAVWALSVSFGMQSVALAATTGWALVAVSATTGLTLVNSAIIAGVGVWALSATFGMQGVALAVTTGFLGTAAAATAGLTAVNSAIIAGVGVWALSVQLGFATINAAVSTGFINVGAAVSIGMAAGNAAITAGMAVWVAAITSSMAVIVSAVQVGVAQMSLAVSTGFSAIAAAAAAGMAAVNSQVIAGMSSVRASVQVGISGAVATLNASVGQFRAAGSNMGAALAAGLNSQVGAVQAAAARLANAAAAATRAAAAIRSPSRVFTRLGDYMGQGLAVGLEGSEDRIIASARTLVDRVVAETSRLGDGVASASQRAVDASARQITQLSDKGKAAQEILDQINSGGAVFEDFSFKGSSKLVDQLNDSIADAFYQAGNDFELPAMRAFLQDLVKANTTTVSVAPPPREDGSTQAVRDLQAAIAALISTLSRLNSGDVVVADEIRAQTAAFIAALRQVPPMSAADRRVLADTGAW